MTDNGIPPESALIGSAHEFAWGDVRRVFVCTRGGWFDGDKLWDDVDMSEYGWRWVKHA